MPGTVGSRGEPARVSNAEGVGGAGMSGHDGGVAPAVGVAPCGPCQKETWKPGMFRSHFSKRSQKPGFTFQ